MMRCFVYYLANKTRIMATHLVHFQKHFDHIYRLNRRIGSHDQEQHEEGPLIRESIKDEHSMDDEIAQEDYTPPPLNYIEKQLPEANVPLISKKEGKKTSQKDILFTQDREATSKACRDICSFLSSSHHIVWVLFLLLLTASPWVAKGYLQFFLAEWIEANDQTQSRFQVLFCIIIFLHILFAVISSLIIYCIILAISSKLHSRMTESVIRAKAAFFFQNPFGAIITRFSKDISTMDLILPFQMLLFIDVLWRCILAAMMSLLAYPFILIFLVFLLMLMFLIRKVSLTLSLEAMKLEALTRSPVNDFFAASYEGHFTIRVYRREKEMIAKFDQLVQENAKTLFTVEAANRWLAFYLDCLVSLYLFSVVIAVMINAQNLKENANYAGITLSMSMELAGLFHYLITVTANIANSLTSFKRIQSYINLTPQQYFKTQDQPLQWKKDRRPEIVFTNLSLKYRAELDYVLSDINLKIAPGTKLGIVGRTGSGKSSLLSALLKFVSPSEGKIEIFSSDIKVLPVNVIRSEIGFITQEAFLIEGTVRRNIDYEWRYEDEDIRDILEKLELEDKINTLPLGLNTPLSEEKGEMFSAGEKQLLCLARALIQNKPIILIDEVTANVDKRTDEVIQKALRCYFKENTVITVAHKLQSIIDYDEVIVMDSGRIVERGTPLALLAENQDDRFISKRGHFAELVKSTGRQESERLLQSARKKKNE